MASTPLMPSGLFDFVGSGGGGAIPGQSLTTGGGSFMQAQMGQQGIQNALQQGNAYNAPSVPQYATSVKHLRVSRIQATMSQFPHLIGPQDCPHGQPAIILNRATNIEHDAIDYTYRHSCVSCHAQEQLTMEIERAKLASQAKMVERKLQQQQVAAKDEKVENKELLPDVSLTRVFKWALIVLVAVALGEKIWSKLGPSLTDNFCKVLGHAQEKTSA